jgi:tetratricopeptide (TPR) repeat protein
MRQILRRLLLGSAAVLAFALPATAVRGEDAPTPATDVEKKDDKNPAVDLKLSKAQGLKWRAARAEFWQKKSEESSWQPRWFFHLGRHWQEARDYEKAVAAFEKFFAYTPDAADQKAVTDNQTNKEKAHKELIDIYFRLKKYDKSSAEGRKWAEDYSTSPAVNEVWDQVGQAERCGGSDEKAIEAFGKAAEGKYVRGYLDLIDLHVAAGKLDAAKEVIAKYEGDLSEKKSELLPWVKGLVDAIGADAQPLDKAVSVAPTEAPKAWSQATILYRFGMQTNNFDSKLENIEMLRRTYADKCIALGLATYQKYNVYTKKVEPELSKDDETKGMKDLLGQSPKRIPGAILVEPDFLEAIHAKFDNQITIVDEKGKLRYARSNEEKPYDYLAAEIALKTIIGIK